MTSTSPASLLSIGHWNFREQGFLLDTNIPSELTKPIPDSRVSAWIGSHARLHLSVMSVGELRKGFHLLVQGKRRTQLEEWFKNFLLPLVAPSILPVTEAIVERWDIMSSQRQLKGIPLNTADGLIAATSSFGDSQHKGLL